MIEQEGSSNEEVLLFFDAPLSQDPFEAWMLTMTSKGFAPRYHLGAPPACSQGKHGQSPPRAVIVWKKGWEYAVWFEATPKRNPEVYPHWFLFRQGMNDLGYDLPMWWWQWSPGTA